MVIDSCPYNHWSQIFIQKAVCVGEVHFGPVSHKCLYNKITFKWSTASELRKGLKLVGPKIELGNNIQNGTAKELQCSLEKSNQIHNITPQKNGIKWIKKIVPPSLAEICVRLTIPLNYWPVRLIPLAHSSGQLVNVLSQWKPLGKQKTVHPEVNEKEMNHCSSVSPVLLFALEILVTIIAPAPE